jgi:low affinity Fe/Cu permease
MAKKRNTGNILNFVAWITGVLVSLSVGFAMINGTLSLPSYLGGSMLALIVGWVVVITTAVSVVLAIIQR